MTARNDSERPGAEKCRDGPPGRGVHARRLEQLAGIASVAIVGAPEDEIRIDLNPERMRALGLTG